MKFEIESRALLTDVVMTTDCFELISECSVVSQCVSFMYVQKFLNDSIVLVMYSTEDKTQNET